MHVIFIIILLILLYLAIVNWHITIPILAFFIYLCNLAMCTPQQIRNPFRHILWWLFLILLTVGIYHRESITIFGYKVHNEYTYQHNDPIFKHFLVSEEELAPLTTAPSPTPDELYGGLKRGMSPFRCVLHLTLHKELTKDLALDSIYLSDMNCHYSDNRLYGISFRIYPTDDSSSVDIHQKATEFFCQKYGAPHHQVIHEIHRINYWKFAKKHILLIHPRKSIAGYLYIYNPQMLQQKIDAHLEEEARRKAEIETIIKQREEEILQQEKAQKEEEKRKEEENLRLRESL